MQTKINDLQNDLNAKMQDAQLGSATDIQTTDMKARAELEKNAADNRTAEKIAMMNAAVDHANHIVDGASMGEAKREDE